MGANPEKWLDLLETFRWLWFASLSIASWTDHTDSDPKDYPPRKTMYTTVNLWTCVTHNWIIVYFNSATVQLAEPCDPLPWHSLLGHHDTFSTSDTEKILMFRHKRPVHIFCCPRPCFRVVYWLYYCTVSSTLVDKWMWCRWQGCRISKNQSDLLYTLGKFPRWATTR